MAFSRNFKTGKRVKLKSIPLLNNRGMQCKIRNEYILQ